MDHLKINALVDALLSDKSGHLPSSMQTLSLSLWQIAALINAVSFWKDNVQVNEANSHRGIKEKCGSPALNNILEQLWEMGNNCLDEPLDLGE